MGYFKRVCVDIDGVLNKWNDAIFARYGLTPADNVPNGDFDVVKTLNKSLADHGRPPVTPSFFWNNIPRSLWAECEKSDEANFILSRAVDLVGRSGVILLTSPTKDPESLAGKLEWIHANMPSWLHRQFLIGPVKWFCAQPRVLLVDDSDHNCDTFYDPPDGRPGGMGLLVPRPWNRDYFRPTLPILTDRFNFCEKYTGDANG